MNLSKCPYCGSSDIAECDGIDEHMQQDIILPKVQTTLYRKRKYYCGKCKRTVTGKGTNELPKSKIGPMAKAWAVFLKFGVKISDRDIVNILKMVGLDVAASSIVGFREQLKREAFTIYKALIASLKQGKFAHWDETGTKIDGDNAWRWKVSNKRVSVTHTDRSRGQKVVEEIFEDAIRLHKEYRDKKWDKGYYRRRGVITASLNDFRFPNPDRKILNRFAKRLKRHKAELFTFLYIKGIDYHNNHAEREIRQDVLLRKVTFGNRSDRGAKVHDVVMSILQTAKLNKMDPVKTFKEILLGGCKNPFAEILTAPP